MAQAFCADAMLIMASVVHLGKSGLPKKVDTTVVSAFVCLAIHYRSLPGDRLSLRMIWIV